MQINIKLDGIEEAIKKFSPDRVAKSARYALRRVVDRSKTVTSTAIRDVYNIKKKDLDKRIIVKSYNPHTLSATLLLRGGGKKITEGQQMADDLSGGAGIGLWYFGGKVVPGTRQNVTVKSHLRLYQSGRGLFGKGINHAVNIPSHTSTRIKGGGISAKILKLGNRTFVPGSFKVKFNLGHIGVMKRRTSVKTNTGKEALRKRAAISIGSMFLNKRTDALYKLQREAIYTWRKEFDRQLRR